MKKAARHESDCDDDELVVGRPNERTRCEVGVATAYKEVHEPFRRVLIGGGRVPRLITSSLL